MKKPVKYSPEVMERAVRMVLEAKDQYESQWAAIVSISAKMGCTAETYGAGCANMSVTRACAMARERPNKSASRRWNARCVSYARRTRFCGWPVRFSPRRSSTAASSREGLHRSAPEYLRGRADLHGVAGRPVGVLASCSSAARSLVAECAGAARVSPDSAHRAGLAGQPAGLWGRQGLAPTAPGGHQGGPLHGRAAHAPVWPAWCDPR